MKVLVLICGASGMIYALELLKALKGHVEIHLMMSPNVPTVAAYEGVDVEELRSMADVEHEYSMSSGPCSGSYKLDRTIAIPCSVKTMCSAAYGIVADPISRALFVSLKEKRRTVVVFRETPMTLSMVECIKRLLLEGAVVTPASPGLYTGVKTLDEAAKFFIQRVLDRADIDIKIARRRLE